MQNKPSNDQHKSIYYRLRRSDPHERLSARLRHFSFGAAVFFVVAAAGIVTHSLYNIQIKQGATFRQYAAQQQLLDSTIQATRGEIYDASGITLASTSVVWTIWADPSYSTALFTSQTVEETGEAVKTVDETTLADVSRQLTFQFRLTIHIQGLIVLAVRLPWLCSLTVKHIVCADICHFTVQLLADIRNVLRAASVDSTYFRHVFIILCHVHGRPRCAVDHGIRIHIRNCLFYGVPIGDIQ